MYENKANQQIDWLIDWFLHFYFNTVISFSYKPSLHESRLERGVNTVELL